MNDIELSRIEEIKKLHRELQETTVDKAIRIGEILTEQKKILSHGEFGKWVKDNLPFTQRTAQVYMRVFKNKDHLKSEIASHLTSLYRGLIEHKEKKNIPSAFKGKGDEFLKEARRVLFYICCESVWYDRDWSNERNYEILMEIHSVYEKEYGIPNILTPELLQVYKQVAEEHERELWNAIEIYETQGIKIPFDSWDDLIFNLKKDKEGNYI